MVNPPKEGDPSYEQHKAESEGIIASMRRRARIMTDGFNACEGVTCNYTEGAMYSFPRLHLPAKVRLLPSTHITLHAVAQQMVCLPQPAKSVDFPTEASAGRKELPH